nr:hypothetical protein [Marinicella sp. W31]MDC2877144.1 hypothetical protein [Marinicella sp. W31]
MAFALFLPSDLAQLDRVVLDHHVGQKFLTHGGNIGLCLGAVVGIKRKVEDLTLPRAGQPVETQAVQGAFNGLSCGSRTPFFKVTMTRALITGSNPNLLFDKYRSGCA